MHEHHYNDLRHISVRYVACDADGNRTCESTVSSCAPSTDVWNFQYDGADRLLGAAYDNGAPSCGEPSFASATECLTCDGNGELESSSYDDPDAGQSTSKYFTTVCACDPPALA